MLGPWDNLVIIRHQEIVLKSITALLQSNEQSILSDWTQEQLRALGRKANEADVKGQCRDFLRLMTQTTQEQGEDSILGAGWEPVRKMLAEVSKSRSLLGFTPSETATFIFSLKRPLFSAIGRDVSDAKELAALTWKATELLDGLGLYTMEAYQKSREEVILRQQEEMLELSTPVVKLWDGILALPMIGTLDSSRTQVVMETLLQKIVDTGSEIAIIDITGVPTVDTLVAQHLIKTVTAARLMGAECIISGIRPQIAATIVHLGVDLGNVITKASLADAFTIALSRMGKSVGRASSPGLREIRK